MDDGVSREMLTASPVMVLLPPYGNNEVPSGDSIIISISSSIRSEPCTVRCSDALYSDTRCDRSCRCVCSSKDLLSFKSFRSLSDHFTRAFFLLTANTATTTTTILIIELSAPLSLSVCLIACALHQILTLPTSTTLDSSSSSSSSQPFYTTSFGQVCVDCFSC